MSEPWEIERMLLWFKAQLPEHELGNWYFQRQPHAETVADESPMMRVAGTTGNGRLIGHGECLRCGQRFTLKRWAGNYSLYEDERQHELAATYPSLTTEARIADAKERLQRDAELAGKCWGDVPEVPARQGAALLDVT